MKMLFVAVFLIGVQQIHTSDSEGAELFKACLNTSDGVNTEPGTNCQKYYECRNNTLVNRHSCEDEYIFDIITKKCVPENEATCVDIDCTEDSNPFKFFTIPGTKCRMYYRCVNSYKSIYSCPKPDQIFNYELQTCVKNGYCYEPVCTGRINGYHPDTTQQCQRSFWCYGGKITIVRNCPSDQVYSSTIKSCVGVPYAMETCESPQKTSIAFPPIEQNGHKCSKLEDGLYSEPNTLCKEYFICKNGLNLGTLSCSDGYNFDGKNCVLESLIPCKDVCFTLQDGIHVDLYSGCKKFVICANGRLIWNGSCPHGTVHNGLDCVDRSLYKCLIEKPIDTNVCRNKKDGFHRNYGNCKEYFYCANGEIVLKGTCPEKQVYNGETCVEKSWFFCEGPEPWVGCLVQNGLYQDKNSRCRNYYYCKNGNRTKYSCPPTEVFNGEMCVPIYLYECPLKEYNICEGKTDGYYSDNSSSCRSYYFCSNGHKNMYICPENKVFNGEKCVSSDQYQCLNISPDCLNKSNGYHFDLTSNCKKYFYCLNNEKITSFSCPNKLIFNGLSCIEPKLFTCPVKINGDFCLHKTDGYYVQPKTKCQKYVHCKNKTISDYISCPEDKIFDGISLCVSNKCKKNDSMICQKDGLYVDYKSSCKAYFSCIDGKLTTLQCPEGNLFNGQICVEEKKYYCPEICSKRDYCDI